MLDSILIQTKQAQRDLARLTAEQRVLCLKNIADALKTHTEEILKENQKDICIAKENQISAAMIERMTLNQKRIENLSLSILEVAKLEEVVYMPIEEIRRPNGLKIIKERVPFGVIGVIFESRPNVCVEIACLCIKTANACVLKGGKESIFTNLILTRLMKTAIKEVVNPDCIYLIEDNRREITQELITKREYIDLLIPRGGKELINYVIYHTTIPYIETGAGNCHLYVHKDANRDMAIQIAINAKYQRPSVCNAIENILVDEEIADSFLPLLNKEFKNLNIEIRGCEKTRSIISCIEATEEDFYTEYNDWIVSVKIVSDIDEAIEHVNRHSSKHSEAIVTQNPEAYEKFLNEVDSACVYHNASTRFTDGGEFGFGAELGISTQKLHARGPMGLKEICSYKYKILGNGQVR